MGLEEMQIFFCFFKDNFKIKNKNKHISFFCLKMFKFSTQNETKKKKITKHC